MPSSQYFASCPKGLEQLLLQELSSLGALDVRETVAGVYFSAEPQLVYSVCMWSRLANKVFLPVVNGPVQEADDLYRLAGTIPWEAHFLPNAKMRVDFSGTNDLIRHTNFGGQLIKDAVVDRLRDVHGERPSVSKDDPDLIVNARLSRGKVHISLDLSGDSLHRRGYRAGQGIAPLKENLAAALLIRSGWPEIAKAGGALIDPMCGSATFLIEGAMMAADIAPGILRKRFGFHGWKQFDETLFAPVKDGALERKRQGLAGKLPEIRGYDIDPSVLDRAEDNIYAAGLGKVVRVSKKAINEFKKPTHKEIDTGLVICNPPYGERLGEIDGLRNTYHQLAQSIKTELPGWQFGVFTGNPELGKELRLRARKKFKFFNGTIPSELLLFDIVSGDQATLRESKEGKEDKTQQYNGSLHQRPLSPGAEMVANRIAKNRKRLASWLNKENIQCYRVYDADMPEYSAAIDVYGNELHIQEYAAPASVDERKAQTRFDELVHATAATFKVEEDKLHTKERRRNKGKRQYEKLHSGAAENSHFFEVNEGQAKLLVNLQDYLDTGLFLDHRPLRKRIFEEAKGKKFLNLFCYTATATVHAALGGASSSVSVDMSNTYIDWAARNFALNNVHKTRHLLERADCITWLKQCREGFDIIMLDPPSFSNSKKMDDVLDIQKDHVQLIERCMDILLPGGKLYFSNNFRKFKLDDALLNKYQVEDIKQATLDVDFSGNSKIHHCWEISAK